MTRLLFSSIILKNVMKNFFIKNWSILIPIITGAIILGAGLFLNHSKTDSVRDSTLAMMVTFSWSLLVKISRYQEQLEGNRDVVNKFLETLGFSKNLKRNIEYIYELHEKDDSFNLFFLNHINEDFSRTLKRLKDGAFHCDVESEQTLTKRILHICKNSVKAVSYNEVNEWWLSNNGENYLNTHNNQITARNIPTTRIFILKEGEEQKLVEVLARHVELGIYTYIVEERYIEANKRVEFVIYDGCLLRLTSKSPIKQVGIETVFTSDENEIEKYQSIFDHILMVAESKGKCIAPFRFDSNQAISK